jgi:hypothetical protein
VFFSSTLTPGKKLKEIIGDGHVLEENLLQFFQIRSELAVTAPARLGL